MVPVKVFREGKETFCEWRYEDGKPLGRILNQGEGFFLEPEFSSLEEARAFCQRELEKDASPFFHVLQGDDIIASVYNDAYHTAKDKKENRIYAAVSLVIVMLLATAVSLLFMPFQATTHHVMFIGGMGGFYLLLYSIGEHWNLEGVAVVIMLLVLLSILVPLLAT